MGGDFFSIRVKELYSADYDDDFSGKKGVLFCSHGTGGLASRVKDISAVLPDSEIETNVLGVYRDDIPECRETINY